MLFEVAYRCVLLEFWQKNHGNPYYEPTIMIHDEQTSHYTTHNLHYCQEEEQLQVGTTSLTYQWPPHHSCSVVCPHHNSAPWYLTRHLMRRCGNNQMCSAILQIFQRMQHNLYRYPVNILSVALQKLVQNILMIWVSILNDFIPIRSMCGCFIRIYRHGCCQGCVDFAKYHDITIYRGDCSIRVSDCSIRVFQSFFTSQFQVVTYSSAMLLNVLHYSYHKG